MSEKIVSDKDILGGKHRVEGTRVRVIDVVGSYQELGWDVEEISEEYDLTPQQVLVALKYYYDNKAQIRDELVSEARENVNA